MHVAALCIRPMSPLQRETSPIATKYFRRIRILMPLE